MTLTLANGSLDPTLTQGTAQQRPRPAAQAAQQFEGLLIKHLLEVMRSTSSGLSSGQAGQYMEMFEGALAEELAKAGGIGIAPLLQTTLDPQADQADGTVPRPVSSVSAGYPAPQPLQTTAPAGPPAGAALAGESGALQRTAAHMLDAGAQRWAKDAALSESDLRSDFATREPGGLARFNVRDARGFRGYYKCNLFAMEAARRAGFAVPLVSRPAGWGFPASDSVTRDAQDGHMRGDWARVATGATATELDGAILQGQRAYILTGAGQGERMGHMAVVERVHQVDYGPDGDVRRVVFDGWEARAQGAQHLVRRTWNLFGNPGGTQARSGFERIEILELKRPNGGSRPERPVSGRTGASILDVSASRSVANHPRPRVEEQP